MNDETFTLHVDGNAILAHGPTVEDAYLQLLLDMTPDDACALGDQRVTAEGKVLRASIDFALSSPPPPASLSCREIAAAPGSYLLIKVFSTPAADILVQPEPPPAASSGDVWAEVIAGEDDPQLRDLFEARRLQGIQKYGTPLQRGNGRHAVADALQEALDGIAYARQAGLPEVEAAFRRAAVLLVGAT